jgi:hypothetical protein
MKKIILAGISMLFLLAARAQDQLMVDPNASIRTLNGSFNKIRVGHAIKVIITQSGSESLAVSAAEEKYKDEIKTEIVNHTLMIFQKGGNDWKSRDRKLRVYVSFRDLNQLDVNGASDVAVVGKATINELTLNISGASTMKGTFAVQKFDIEMDGASKASLSGDAATLNLECSGAADLNAYDLKIINANVTVSGASDVDISVEKDLNATASGASRIHYKGNAANVNAKTSGASSISRKD